MNDNDNDDTRDMAENPEKRPVKAEQDKTPLADELREFAQELARVERTVGDVDIDVALQIDRGEVHVEQFTLNYADEEHALPDGLENMGIMPVGGMPGMTEAEPEEAETDGQERSGFR